MAATPSLLVTYTFPGSGPSGTCTNRFHFSGGTPSDNAHWTTLSDAVVTAMKACLTDYCQIVEVKGFLAGGTVAVFTKTYTTVGTYSSSGKEFAPGQCCCLIRFGTAARSSKNHPVYLFNYIHGILLEGSSAAQAQEVESGLVTAIASFAETWWNTGFSDGTNTYLRAGPNGATATSRTVTNQVRTHRLTPR